MSLNMSLMKGSERILQQFRPTFTYYLSEPLRG